MKNKTIRLDHGMQKEIGLKLGVSRELVSKACRFESNSAAAKQIRKVAVLEYKGSCCGTTAATVLKEAGL